MEKPQVVQARIPIETKLKLRSYCKKNDCTEARAVRRALTIFLQKANTKTSTD